jgi:ketosteroid isomerase-like protein
MSLTRRHLALAGAAALGTSRLLAGTPAFADSAEDVSQAVEALRKAMLAADAAQLSALVHDRLSYGHSSGKLQDKADFIDVIVSKKTIYKSITLSEPGVAVVGNNAIARHVFDGETESDGKLGSAHIGVLQVWLKDGSWKLLARQAYKI